MMHTKGHPHVELDGFYHDHHPALSHSPSLLSDPVERHGQQFWEMAIQQKERVKQQELLSKVFSSWQQRRTESSGPVSADVIANLKRTSRLLHYCSSPILLECTGSGHDFLLRETERSSLAQHEDVGMHHGSR